MSGLAQEPAVSSGFSGARGYYGVRGAKTFQPSADLRWAAVLGLPLA
jgi:hypothetical protein